MLRVGGVEVGLHPGVVLHTVRQRVADVAHVVALLELEGRRCRWSGTQRADKEEQADKNENAKLQDLLAKDTEKKFSQKVNR